MTTYLDDWFTGSDWASWGSGWAWTSLTTAGAYSTIFSNAGRLNAGSLTGYTGRMSMRVSGVSVATVRARLRGVTFRGSVNGAFVCCLRADTELNNGTGYYLYLDRGAQQLRMVRVLSYSGVNIATPISYALAQDVPHEIDFYVSGSSIKAWVWPSSGSKPSSPMFDITNTEVSSPGVAGVLHVGGADPGGIVDIDRATFTDGSGDLMITSSITAYGTLIRKPGKRYTGSVTPTGSLTKMKVILRNFSGSITASGALLRGRLRIFSAAITASGARKSTPRKILSGSTSPSGSLIKGMLRTMTGAIAPSGVIVTNYLGRLVGDSATVRVVASALSWVRITARRWTT